MHGVNNMKRRYKVGYLAVLITMSVVFLFGSSPHGRIEITSLFTGSQIDTTNNNIVLDAVTELSPDDMFPKLLSTKVDLTFSEARFEFITPDSLIDEKSMTKKDITNPVSFTVTSHGCPDTTKEEVFVEVVENNEIPTYKKTWIEQNCTIKDKHEAEMMNLSIDDTYDCSYWERTQNGTRVIKVTNYYDSAKFRFRPNTKYIILIRIHYPAGLGEIRREFTIKGTFSKKEIGGEKDIILIKKDWKKEMIR